MKSRGAILLLFHFYLAASRTGSTIYHPSLLQFLFSFLMCLSRLNYLLPHSNIYLSKIQMSKFFNVRVQIANILMQSLTFSFHLYSAASRTGYTICHRPPPLFLFSISFAICAEKSNPAKFFSLAFLPIPAAAAFFYFQNLDTPLLSILPHIFFSNLLFLIMWKANICLILEATGCHVRDILRSGVEPA